MMSSVGVHKGLFSAAELTVQTRVSALASLMRAAHHLLVFPRYKHPAYTSRLGVGLIVIIAEAAAGQPTLELALLFVWAREIRRAFPSPPLLTLRHAEAIIVYRTSRLSTS